MKYLYLAMSLFLLVACGQDLNTEEDPLYKEVMEVHDEVMPKIKEMKKLKNQLTKLHEANGSADLLQGIQKIERADEMMFYWMDNFKQKSDMAEGQNYDAYLKLEKTKITAVSKAMKSSMSNAQNLIARQNSNE